MLRKNELIHIPEEEPFKNDKLDRAPVIRNLTKLVSSLNQPLVLSINSPWGTGKTASIKMWQQSLKNGSKRGDRQVEPLSPPTGGTVEICCFLYYTLVDEEITWSVRNAGAFR